MLCCPSLRHLLFVVHICPSRTPCPSRLSPYVPLKTALLHLLPILMYLCTNWSHFTLLMTGLPPHTPPPPILLFSFPPPAQPRSPEQSLLPSAPVFRFPYPPQRS